MPEHPQLAVHLHRVIGEGRGPGNITVEGRPCLIIPHHVLSRLAQRCGARTAADLIAGMLAFWEAAAVPVQKRLDGEREPAAGWRVPFTTPTGSALVVFRQDDEWGALVAVTVLSA